MVTFRAALLFVALIANVVLCTPALAKVEFHQETINKLDALVDSKVSWSGNTPAYSILIDQGGKIVYESNTGFADIGNRIPATRNTVYKLGSITKSFTALAVLQLVEKGEIDLDGTVSDYLADFEGPASEVTVRQLLTHTSGIPNYTDLPEAEPIFLGLITKREYIVALFKDKPLEFEPGSVYSYSNSGFYLLGMIIEAVSEQDYFDYIKTNIFEPLDLRATYVGDYAEIVSPQARGYVVTPEGYINATPVPQLTPFSAGTLDGSAEDLIKYRRAVFKSETISEVLRDLITTTGVFPNGVKQHYALGALTITDFYGHRKLGHSGSITGFASHHEYFPDEDITIVAFVNANGAPVRLGSLIAKMAREIFSIPQPRETEVEVSGQLLESYVGKYRMSPFRQFGEFARIVLREGALQLQVNDDDENPSLIPLFPRTDNEFVLAIDDELRIRFITEAEEVTGLELFSYDRVMPAYRVKPKQE